MASNLPPATLGGPAGNMYDIFPNSSLVTIS